MTLNDAGTATLQPPGMYILLAFFVLHWQSSVFCQTFFLHRFGAHRQFTMSKGWERFFHVREDMKEAVPAFLHR